MILNKKNEIEYLTFNSFEKTNLVKHCFSTRKGGLSKGVYESMNLAFREESRENVIKNYELICDAIGCDYKNVVFSDQVHEDRLYFVNEEDSGKGLLRESDIIGYDSLITDKKGLVLTTFYADCVPLFFLDTEKEVIALTHSGWKGTVKQIGSKTIDAMVKEYGCQKENIIAGIGPCIGGCCFEVDEPVVNEFLEKIPFSKSFIFTNSKNKSKFNIDLQGVNRQILINAGIDAEKIELANACTKCSPDMFFSHRHMGAERGSLAALMCLIWGA